MRRGRAYNRDRWANRFAIIGITVVVGFLAVAVNIRGASLKKQQKDNTIRMESLSAAIEEESQRSAELNDEKVRVKTKQYIEQMAREKLGLVMPDEVVIEPKNSK